VKHKAIIVTVALVIAGGLSLFAQTPEFNIIKPSTTGVPGEEVRVMKFDPAGNLWIGGRFYFWEEAGLAMLSPDQLDPQPLPGGGFDTGAWKVWSSVHHAIPSVFINDIQFAANGVIWIASDGGLTRFDRSAPTEEQMWFTYTPANSPLILSEVRSLAMDSQGNLWLTNVSVQFSDGALFRFNPTSNVWTKYRVGQQLPWTPPWYNVNAVYVGPNDHVWLTHSVLGGMAEFNGTSWVLHDSPYQMDAMLADFQNNIWVRSSQYGLFKWNGSSWQNWPTVGGTITMTGLGKDLDGIVCVSTWYGDVYKMINDNPVFFVNADNIPRDVIARPNGNIWINNYGGNGTLGTVRQYTASGQLLRRINSFNSGLPDYFVDRITHDSSGNMWFATGEGGLSRMLGSNGARDAATHWRNWGNHNDLSEPYPWAGNDPMYSVLEDNNGIFWMGGNGIGRWNSATGTFTDFWNWENSNLPTDGIKSIVKRQGTIWGGSAGSGVFWLNGNDWIHVTLSPNGYNYSFNNVYTMSVDTENNLWVGSEYGLRKFVAGNNNTFTMYDTSNSPLPSAWIFDIEPDPSGGIWIGTGAGLVRFDGVNWMIYNQANTGMPGTIVYDVARRASDGLIAIANNQPQTYPYTGGVSTFDGTHWTHYTPANSPLTHWQVVAVEFDADGNLWASPLSTGVVQIIIGNTPSPTPTPTPSPTATSTATPTATATASATPTPTPTPAATVTPTPRPTPSPRARSTPRPQPTPRQRM
jgi:ligand-binding sensor domain-containing protein